MEGHSRAGCVRGRPALALSKMRNYVCSSKRLEVFPMSAHDTQAIATARRLADHGDIQTAWFVLRDLEATKAAGLSDLAWSGHRQGNMTEGELNDFIAELEAWMRKERP